MHTTQVQIEGMLGTVSEHLALSQMLSNTEIMRQQLRALNAASSALPARQSYALDRVSFDHDSVVPPSASLTDSNFNSFLECTGPATLVKFSATWCEVSTSLRRHFATAAELLHVRFANVDIDVSPQTTGVNAVRSVPTLILFRNGKELSRHSGAMSVSLMKHWVQASLLTEV